jgi:hypothetical protein
MVHEEENFGAILTSNPELWPFLSIENPNVTLGLDINPDILEQADLLDWLIKKREDEHFHCVQLKQQAGLELINDLLSLPTPRLSKEIVNWMMDEGEREYELIL